MTVFATVCGALLAARAGNVAPPRPPESAPEGEQPDPIERPPDDPHRAYSRHVRNAFLAWRGGDPRAAAVSLDLAHREAVARAEEPDFAHSYLARVLKSGQPTTTSPDGPVTALTVSPDATRLATGHADGTLAVWDGKTGRRLGSVTAHTAGVTHVGYALDGALVVTAGPAGPERYGTEEMLGWAVDPDGSLAPAPAPRRSLGKGVYCLAVAPGGAVVYAGGHNGLLLKRHLRDPGRGLTVEGAPGRAAVTALAVSPDGTRVLTADGKGSVKRWTADLAVDDTLRDYEFGGGVTALAASPAGLPIIGFADGPIIAVAPVCHPWHRPAARSTGSPRRPPGTR
jgi:hypothetical protein